jgi:hypothetical protein
MVRVGWSEVRWRGGLVRCVDAKTYPRVQRESAKGGLHQGRGPVVLLSSRTSGPAVAPTAAFKASKIGAALQDAAQVKKLGVGLPTWGRTTECRAGPWLIGRWSAGRAWGGGA